MCNKKVSGIVLICLGLLLAIALTIGMVALKDVIGAVLKSVGQYPTDTSSDGYKKYVGLFYNEWDNGLSTSADASSITTYKHYIYHVTNAQAVAASTASSPVLPIVSEKGPYVYKQYTKKILVSYSSDKSQVSWFDMQRSLFDAASSGSLTEADTWTTAWTGYAAVLSKASYSQTGALANALGPFATASIAYAYATSATPSAANVAAAMMHWGSSVGTKAIPLSTCTASSTTSTAGCPNILINPVFQDKIPVVIEFNKWVTSVWVGACTTLNPTLCPGNLVSTDYTLTLAQVTSIWTNTTQLAGKPVCWSTSCIVNSVSGSAVLFGAVYAELLGGPAGAIAGLAQIYGVSQNTVKLLFYYLQVNTGLLMVEIGKKTNATNYNPTGDNGYYFRTTTVKDFLYAQFMDPFVSFLTNSVSSSAPFAETCQDTSTAATRTACETSLTNSTLSTYVGGQLNTVNTGFTSTTSVDKFIKWKGMTSLPSVGATKTYWCNYNQTVNGNNSPSFAASTTTEGASSFTLSPSRDYTQSFSIWATDLYRTADFSYTGDVTLPGAPDVPLKAYTLASSSLAINANYQQTFVGVINLSCPRSAPIAVTLPRYYQTDNATLSSNYTLIADSTKTANAADSASYLYIDPFSGYTLSGQYRLQVNIDIPAATTGINPGTKRMLMPSYWTIKSGGASASTLATLNSSYNQVKTGLNIAIAFFVIGLVVGISMVFIGLFLLYKSKQEEADISASGTAYNVNNDGAELGTVNSRTL